MRTFITIIWVLASIGCRQPAGQADYASQETFVLDAGITGMDVAEFITGPAPYMSGDVRLAVGIFYEGGSSLNLNLNPPDRDLQVFVLDMEDPENSLTVQIEGTDDRVEGRSADRFVFNHTWFGSQVIYQDRTEDLREWTTLHVSLKSTDTSAVDIEITMNGNGVDASQYGYRNDGEWHHLAIPTAAFETDLSSIDRPFGLNGSNVTVGESFIVDNVYFTQSTETTATASPPSGGISSNGGEDDASASGAGISGLSAGAANEATAGEMAADSAGNAEDGAVIASSLAGQRGDSNETVDSAGTPAAGHMISDRGAEQNSAAAGRMTTSGGDQAGARVE